MSLSHTMETTVRFNRCTLIDWCLYPVAGGQHLPCPDTWPAEADLRAVSAGGQQVFHIFRIL